LLHGRPEKQLDHHQHHHRPVQHHLPLRPARCFRHRLLLLRPRSEHEVAVPASDRCLPLPRHFRCCAVWPCNSGRRATHRTVIPTRRAPQCPAAAAGANGPNLSRAQRRCVAGSLLPSRSSALPPVRLCGTGRSATSPPMVPRLELTSWHISFVFSGSASAHSARKLSTVSHSVSHSPLAFLNSKQMTSMSGSMAKAGAAAPPPSIERPSNVAAATPLRELMVMVCMFDSSRKLR